MVKESKVNPRSPIKEVQMDQRAEQRHCMKEMEFEMGRSYIRMIRYL